MANVKRLALLAGLGTVAGAIAQELRKPVEERQWHGRVAGLIPYDFRKPTLARVKERSWNPSDPHVLTARSFGVGWTINFAQVAKRIKARRAAT